MIDPLSRLAILYGTDKFGYHDYTPNYYRLLQGWQDRSLRMLEIGVGGYGDEERGGESLETWRDFFPNGQITGLDIQRKTMDLGPRVRIVQGSQVDADVLRQVQDDHGPFDIILDDGSHRNDHVVETFGLLFPRLKPGGLYIVEDVQTAFMPRYGGSLDLTDPNMVGFFSALMQALPIGEAGSAAAVERFHNIIVIHKRAVDGPDLSCRTDRALSEAGQVHRIEGAKASADDLDRLAAGAAPGDAILIEGWPEDLSALHDLFVQIDHREIAVTYPDAPIRPAARHVLSLSAYPDGLVLGLGDNSYPSNFGFDVRHPRVASALDAMGQTLDSGDARPNGLMQYAIMMHRYFGPEATDMALDRLGAMGCTIRRYFQMAGQRAQRKKDWQEAATLYEKALRHYPGDPDFTAVLGRAYGALGRMDQARTLLQSARKTHPDARSLVVTLAQIELGAGHVDEAIGLFETSIPLFPRAARPARLEHLVGLCQRRGRMAEARRLCHLWQAQDPDNPKPAEWLAGAD